MQAFPAKMVLYPVNSIKRDCCHLSTFAMLFASRKSYESDEKDNYGCIVFDHGLMQYLKCTKNNERKENIQCGRCFE